MALDGGEKAADFVWGQDLELFPGDAGLVDGVHRVQGNQTQPQGVAEDRLQEHVGGLALAR